MKGLARTLNDCLKISRYDPFIQTPLDTLQLSERFKDSRKSIMSLPPDAPKIPPIPSPIEPSANFFAGSPLIEYLIPRTTQPTPIHKKNAITARNVAIGSVKEKLIIGRSLIIQ